MLVVRYGAAVASGLLLLVLAEAAKSDDVPNLANPQMIAAGRQLFQAKQCAYCHGPDGNGGIKLAGRNDLEPTYIFQTIAEGRLHGNRRMPSWRGVLTDEQIWQATAYVMSLAAPTK
jgi:mono/diheme cytochrome c family protein